MEKEKTSTATIIGCLFLTLVAGLVDIYLISNGISSVPAHRAETMAQAFTGSFADWAGIVLFNLSVFGLIAGLLGYWKLYMPEGSTWFNYAAAAVLAGSLLLIYMV